MVYDNVGESRQIADYYLNTRIPRILHHYGIPDTVEARLAAYNWGIGNLRNAFRKYGEDWINHTNSETSGYITKYDTATD